MRRLTYLLLLPLLAALAALIMAAPAASEAPIKVTSTVLRAAQPPQAMNASGDLALVRQMRSDISGLRGKST